jgi:NAD(P)-dependent dehydrogenase (short-subunit alcohol dehydrogenase family)
MKNSIWIGAVAIITGGGSGIGRSLGIMMASRGTKVVVTDINPESAAATAKACGPQASYFLLDVRDASAVKNIVEDTFRKYGRLDFIFNNAGIGVAGESHEIAAPLWDRILDINLKGVLNGILAAYPIMIRQGHGYIINTASLAGLGPAPLMAPYAMTKHAVVGLSTSLRIEAEKHGVKVILLCPAAIETPILNSFNPEDLPEVPWRPETKRYLTNLAGPPYPVEKLAEEVIAAIEKNKGIIVIPGRARLAWRLGRLFPALVEKMIHKAVGIERSFRKSG